MTGLETKEIQVTEEQTETRAGFMESADAYFCIAGDLNLVVHRSPEGVDLTVCDGDCFKVHRNTRDHAQEFTLPRLFPLVLDLFRDQPSRLEALAVIQEDLALRVTRDILRRDLKNDAEFRAMVDAQDDFEAIRTSLEEGKETKGKEKGTKEKKSS